MDLDDLYPPSPPGGRPPAPASRAYVLRVVLVLLALALFLGVYLGMIAATGFAIVWIVATPVKLGFYGVLAWLGAAMLFAFLIKGIFKSNKLDKRRHLRVTEADQPLLFAFVRRLCAEARSPFPAAVYLTHEVNAAVFHERSLLSLVLPRRKNLLIGLGLVNVLNVSELKAVLAHEFGHFTQGSLKLGQYVYVANRAIHDMVFSRDSWDEFLMHWRRVDLRLSFPAWILTGLVWLIRRLLEQIFRLVNLANLSLSRQMEFDADLCAVGLTGSDALISGLWKTERGGIAMDRAFGTLSALAGYDKFTSDLFFHQRAHNKRLDALLDEKGDGSPHVRSLREPYRYGAAVHFQEGDDHRPSMWATHPSNRDRELNAKKSYVSLPALDRPAWKIFKSRKDLAARLTRRAYEQVLGVEVRAAACLPAKEIEAIAEEERDEQEQAAHYHGLYEDRVLEPGDLRAHAREIDAMDAEGAAALRVEAEAWSGERLLAFMKSLRAACAAAEVLAAGKKGARDLEAAKKKIEALRKRLPEADRAVFRHFYALTADLPEARDELLSRYRFLLSVQEHVVALNGGWNIVQGVLQILGKGGEIGRDKFAQVRGGLCEAHRRLDRLYAKSKGLRAPKLLNLDEGASLQGFLLPDGIVDPPASDRIDGSWIREFLKAYDRALNRLRRLHFKNLGALLKLQESLDPALYGALAPEPAAEEAEAADEEGDAA